nr:YhgE/Pip domain-containing protein [uncultured Acetobacterium sp.]
MLKSEFETLKKNKFLIVLIVVLSLVPTLYTTIFLSSVWDPYSKISELPVALVNEDKSCVYNGSTLNIGEELTRTLEAEKPFACVSVDSLTAQNGLKNGDYYMVVTIPEDFSKNAATLMNADPQPMVLSYEINPGENLFASKTAIAGATAIKNSVSDKVTQTYTEVVFKQISTLKTGMTQAADGAMAINDGSAQLENGNQQITANLKKLSDSSLTFSDGAETLSVGLTQYTNGVGELSQGLQQLNGQLPTLTNGISQILAGSNQLNNGIDRYTTGVGALADGSQELSSSSDSLNAGVASVADGINQVKAVNDQILESVTQNQPQETTDLSGINDSAVEILTNTKNIQNELYSLDVVIESLRTSDDPQAKAQADNLETLRSGIAIDSDGIDHSVSAIQNLGNSGTQTDSTGNPEQLVQALSMMDQGLAQLQQGINDENAGLISGVEHYTAGVNRVAAGLQTLNNQSETLASGSNGLAFAMNELNNRTPLLTSGVSKLADGSSLLSANSNQLISGAGQLANGAVQISSGSSQLAAGSQTLGNGIGSLKDGSQVLAGKLSDGAQALAAVKTDDKNIAMFVSPTAANEESFSVVDNNGTSMAPYIISVALYLGAMAFCLFYPLYDKKDKPKNGINYWLNKSMILLIVSSLQAILAITALMAFNHLSPTNVAATFFIAWITSLCFMSFTSLLKVVLDEAGSFIALIFLILQLSGSSGVYPIELTNSFFQAIHPFLPMTYTIEALKQTLSIGASGTGIGEYTMVLLGIMFVCIGLTLLSYVLKTKKNLAESGTPLKKQTNLSV